MTDHIKIYISYNLKRWFSLKMTKKMNIKRILLALTLSISHPTLSKATEHYFFDKDQSDMLLKKSVEYYTTPLRIPEHTQALTRFGRTSAIKDYSGLGYRHTGLPYFIQDSNQDEEISALVNRYDFYSIMRMLRKILHIPAPLKKPYSRKYKAAIDPSLYKKTMDLVRLLSEENSNFYAQKKKEAEENLSKINNFFKNITDFSDGNNHTFDFEQPDTDALGSHLIPTTDFCTQRSYFFKSLVSLFGEEQTLWPKATTTDVSENYSTVFQQIASILFLGKGSLYQMKGLIENRMSQALPPQTEPIDPSLYKDMDVTDKVCYGYLMAQAEFSADVLDLLSPLLLPVKKNVSTAIYYDFFTQAIGDFTQELKYFSLYFLDEAPITNVIAQETPDVAKTTLAFEETLSKTQRKRAAQKRRKIVQKAHDDIQVKLQEEAEKQQRQAAAKRPQLSVPDIREENVSTTPAISESYFAWVQRTEVSTETHEIQQRGVASLNNQARKKAAKLAKKKRAEISSISEGNVDNAVTTISSSSSSSSSGVPPVHQHILANNHYDTFHAVMEGTYDGEMNPIANMIVNGFGGYAHLGNGRIHLTLREITENKQTNCLFLTPIFDENQEQACSTTTTTSSSSSSSHAKATVHTPHKKGSRRLRPEHVKEIKSLLERAGYTLENVSHK